MIPAILAADEEARALDAMTLQELRQVWCVRFGAPHPPLRSPQLLRRLLGWRLQAAAEGGVSASTKRALTSKAKPRVPGPILRPGVRLTREWRGRACDVEVLATGFLYESRTYKSLSEVAREITGVRWNGPRFFGLRQEAA